MWSGMTPINTYWLTCWRGKARCFRWRQDTCPLWCAGYASGDTSWWSRPPIWCAPIRVATETELGSWHCRLRRPQYCNQKGDTMKTHRLSLCNREPKSPSGTTAHLLLTLISYRGVLKKKNISPKRSVSLVVLFLYHLFSLTHFWPAASPHPDGIVRHSSPPWKNRRTSPPKT